MSKENLHQKKIGVLGGGQLGRMLSLSASNLGFHLHFLDREKDFPAGLVSSQLSIGDFTSKQDVLNFGEDMDILTIEIENVNTEALHELEDAGKKVFPQAKIIDLIKDKGLQKEYYLKQHLPTSTFQLFNNSTEIKNSINEGKVILPFVQKARTEGYDGKGVLVVRNSDDLLDLFNTPSLIEPLVEIEKELAVIVARNENGEVKTYPTVDMVFDQEANLVDYLQCPAMIPQDIDVRCQQIALDVADKLELIGLLAIEFFLTKSGEILINEMAPRTHNSGHLSMNTCITSQFEQHLRSILNLPLGRTDIILPGIMVNLLGEKDYTGPAKYSFINSLLELPGVHVHIYGKKISKPKRKMGHINIVGKDPEKLLETLRQVKKIVP